MKYKFFVFDLDGILINVKKEIILYNWEVLICV